MNISGGGISWNIGPRGASIGIGRRGTYLNTGIPGTGLYARQRIDYSKNNDSTASSNKVKITLGVSVEDDGTVNFIDENGNVCPEKIISIAKKQHGDVIRALLQKKCHEINEQVEALGKIHLYTPSPNTLSQYQIRTFDTPLPKKPSLQKPGFWARFFKSRQISIEKENQEKQNNYLRKLKNWEQEKQTFESAEHKRKDFIENKIYKEVDAMESFLEENLQSIIWPRETLISIEVLNDGKYIFLDVDLPEIEDMPTKIASVPSRGYKLTIKEMSQRQIQKLYMEYIHGTGFRIIGETFSSLPNAQQVTLSAYSQRPNKATGKIEDEYIYSVQVDRSLWSKINFDNLQYIDIIESLTQFNLKREMTKSGIFRAIQPYSPVS
jgi:Protein of unknown function (DUF4236)